MLIKKFTFILSMMFMLAGCTTLEGTPQNNGGVDVDWTEGLTQKQIVQSMPIRIETLKGTQTAANGIVAPHAVGAAGPQHVVTWMVPEGALKPASWEVYEKTNDDEWVLIEGSSLNIQTSSVTEDGVVYDVYSCSLPIPAVTSFINYYKVMMIDHNGASYGNVVSLVSYPGGHPISVTLSEETNAKAHSGVEMIYNGEEQSLWAIQQLNSLALPESKDLEAGLEEWSDLQFTIHTDFTGWGFPETLVSRASNSSYCRVELVEAPAGPVVARLKYSFEDLPLTQIIHETGTAFDYNDVVLYVDILKPELATESGKLLWARDSEGQFSDIAYDTVAFDDGSAVAVGAFWGPITFGAGEVNETSFSNWSGGGFITRYNADGSLRWARGTEANEFQWKSVTGLSDGSIIAAGHFRGPITLGAGEANETTLHSTNWSIDGVIARYSSDGQLMWAKQVAGNNAVYMEQVRAFDDESFAVSGIYYSTEVVFGAGESNTVSLPLFTAPDAFVARYSSDGAVVWARQIQTLSSIGGYSPHIAAHDDGSLTVSDQYNGYVVMDGHSDVSPHSPNSYIARYSADGIVEWLDTLSPLGYNMDLDIQSVAAVPGGGMLLAGYFSGSCGLRSVGNYSSEPANYIPLQTDSSSLYRIFVASYSASGDLLWAKQIGRPDGRHYEMGISAADDGSFALTGSFYNTPLVFGAGELNETTLAPKGDNDIFLALYNGDGTLTWALSEGSVSHDMGYAVSLSDTGYVTVAGRIESYQVTMGAGETNETTLWGLYNGDMFIAKYAR